MDAHINEIYSVILSLKRSMKIFNNENDILHKYRYELDPFVFRALDSMYGKEYDEYWNSIEIPRVSDKAICIVERRCHPNLKFCLQNAAYYARGYSIHIFCSIANIDYINTISGKQFNNIHIYPIFEDIGTPSSGRKEYNELLKSKKFWNSFREEHIITIETDTYFLKPIRESMYTFDYIGSKWISQLDKPGGGGLTYRKLSVMKDILSLDNEELKIHEMQDAFVSHGIQLLNKKYPSIDESPKYFIEGDFTENMDLFIGVHQWWTFISKLDEPSILILIEIFLSLEKL